jgi:hypothetical protein
VAVFTNNVNKHIQHYFDVLKTEAVFTNNVGNIYQSIFNVLSRGRIHKICRRHLSL